MEPQEHEISILYLDDEEHNLSAFKAGFRRRYKIRLALTADQAFKKLNEELPHIIIADQRMPGMSGVEFFERVKEEYPTPTRILLTAYSGSQTVIDAVNRGNIHKFTLKPWNETIMDSILSAGYAMWQSRNEIREKNLELQKVNEELNRFIYSVSHDLRAPLMSVMGLIDLSMEENELSGVRNYLDMMKASTVKMDEYIQSTLEYYRNYKTKITPGEVNLYELVESLISGIRNFSRHLNFELTGPDDLTIYTDANRLKSALNNLISNAAKYGRKDANSDYTVRIAIEATPTGAQIEVKDFGIGIKENELESIFEIFSKSDENFDLQSTGLGLYIVKESIYKIGGTVQVASEYGKGSTFTIQVPDMPM